MKKNVAFLALFIGFVFSAFGQNGNLVIPDGTTTIGADDGYREKNITSVTIPNSVTTIGEYAFLINQLTSLTIPNSVTTIGGRAFYNNKLTSITIPASVTSIGLGAFQANPITRVTFESDSVNGVHGAIDSELGKAYTGSKDSTGRGSGKNAVAGGAGTYVKNSDGTWTKEGGGGTSSRDKSR